MKSTSVKCICIILGIYIFILGNRSYSLSKNSFSGTLPKKSSIYKEAVEKLESIGNFGKVYAERTTALYDILDKIIDPKFYIESEKGKVSYTYPKGIHEFTVIQISLEEEQVKELERITNKLEEETKKIKKEDKIKKYQEGFIEINKALSILLLKGVVEETYTKESDGILGYLAKVIGRISEDLKEKKLEEDLNELLMEDRIGISKENPKIIGRNLYLSFWFAESRDDVKIYYESIFIK